MPQGRVLSQRSSKAAVARSGAPGQDYTQKKAGKFSYQLIQYILNGRKAKIEVNKNYGTTVQTYFSLEV